MPIDIFYLHGIWYHHMAAEVAASSSHILCHMAGVEGENGKNSPQLSHGYITCHVDRKCQLVLGLLQ